MDRYHTMFQNLNAQNQGAFIPFVMLGDPDEETSYQIILTLIANGANALELGIPFSDPTADGPTIQNASLRAFKSNITPTHCFNIISRIRHISPHIPIGLLLYSNLIFAKGLDAFYQQAAAAGTDSILVADVPVRESAPFIHAAKTHNIDHIFIAPPNADRQTLQQIAELSEGYIYLLGRAGVTGTETEVNMPREGLIDHLNHHNAAPPVLGFGISKPQHVTAALAAGARGAISGSATVNIIATYHQQPPLMHEKLADFIQTMKRATTQVGTTSDLRT